MPVKRSMDLVRTILMRLESSPDVWPGNDLGIKAYPTEEIGYHAHIMMQAGLIEGMEVTRNGSAGPEAIPTCLTWKGHEFLDRARDQDRWNRARAIIAKVGGAPISVWAKVLTDLTLRAIETVATRPG